MLKHFFITIAMLTLVTASDLHFGTDLSYRPVPKEKKEDVSELPWMSTDSFKEYLDDHDNRVDDVFAVTPYYFPTVHFWFMIYTQFESNQVIIHDKANLSLIYKVLDFSSLHKKDLGRNVLYVLQNKITNEKVRALKKDLDILIKNPFDLSAPSINILNITRQANIQLPLKRLDRAAYFREMRDNLRTQTGQKNFIREGVIRSLPYQKFLGHFFKERGLPSELLALPFLESSFNPKAESKVGALGCWQFMPHIAAYYVPRRTTLYDYRSNIGLSSIAAASLMEENFKIMKSWDLAVTAYNSGTKHLLKSKRELASNEADLEDIIRHSDSAHFGFASKNFYGEFLALTRALAYREEIFDEIHEHDRPDVNDDLRFFISKCSLRFDKVLTKEQLDDLSFHNQQISNLKRNYPRGIIVSTKLTMPKNKFIEIPLDKVLKYRSKDWSKFLKGQSCSTR